MKKILFGLIAPALSMFSVVMLPMQAAADSCCPPAPCCDQGEDECCDNGWMEKLGLVLVAAGAGALAGWGAAEATKGKGHHHHHGGDFDCAVGPTGPTGATGSDTFSTDIPPSTLTFTLNGSIFVDPENDAFGGTVLGFVSTPDGAVISTTGPMISTTGPLSFSVIITVADAVFGSYETGFVFPEGLLLDPVPSLTGTVVSSRDPTNVTDLIIPVLDSGFPGEYQALQGFVYGTTSGPIFP
jgi:hypothetical protein